MTCLKLGKILRKPFRYVSMTLGFRRLFIYAYNARSYRIPINVFGPHSTYSAYTNDWIPDMAIGHPNLRPNATFNFYTSYSNTKRDLE